MGNALHAGLARPLVSNSFAIRTSANPFSQPLYSCNLQTPPVTAHSKALITLADSTHPRNRPDNPFLFRTYKKPGGGGPEDSLCPNRSNSRLSLPQQIARNDQLLDLARALVNGDDPRVAVHPLDVGLPRIPHAAMNLHRLVRHSVRHLPGKKLRLARRRAHALPRVLEPRRIVRQPARRLDLRLHVRNHPLNRLKLADGFPKCPPLLRVLDRFLQRALRQPDGLRRNPDPPSVQRAQRDLQPLSFFSEAIRGRHFALVQQNLNRGRRPLAHLVLVPPNLESLEGRLDQKGADSPSASLRIALRKNDVHARVAAVRHPGLRAGKAIHRAIPHRSRLNPRRIRSRSRFRQTEGAENFAAGETRQVFFLLLVRAERQNRPLHRGIRHAQRRGHCRVHPRHLFEHEHVRHRVHARSAPLLRRQHAAAAHFAQFLDDVEGKALLALQLFHERPDFRFHELPDGVTNQFLVVPKRKVHRLRYGTAIPGCAFDQSKYQDATTGGKLQFEEFAEALGLLAADGNLRVLLVVHLQHVAGLEPRYHFLDVVNVHEKGPMRPPEGVHVERGVQFLERPVIGAAFSVARDDGDQPIVDRGENQILRIHEQQALLRLHEQFHRMRRAVLLRFRLARPQPADELLEPLRRARLRFDLATRPLKRLGDARLVEGLEHVIHGIHVERLHRVMIERRGEDHVRHFHLPFNKLLQYAEAIEPGHLHVQKNQVGRVLFDQCKRLDAVFPLPDDADFREALEQVRQLFAGRLFVVDNQRVNRHCFAGNSILSNSRCFANKIIREKPRLSALTSMSIGLTCRDWQFSALRLLSEFPSLRWSRHAQEVSAIAQEEGSHFAQRNDLRRSRFWSSARRSGGTDRRADHARGDHASRFGCRVTGTTGRAHCPHPAVSPRNGPVPLGTRRGPHGAGRQSSQGRGARIDRRDRVPRPALPGFSGCFSHARIPRRAHVPVACRRIDRGRGGAGRRRENRFSGVYAPRTGTNDSSRGIARRQVHCGSSLLFPLPLAPVIHG